MFDTVDSLPVVFWVALVLQAIVCAILSGDLADKKGYSSGSWYAAGLFFGVLGLIAAAGLPTKSALHQTGSAMLKKCPDCAEDIRGEAFVCKYCGHKFTKEEAIAALGWALSKGGLGERLQAIRTLTVMGDKSAAPHLIRALAEADSDPSLSLDESQWVDNEACNALKKLGDATMIPDLESILKRGERGMRWQKSVEVLAGLGEPAIPALIGALKHEAVRTSAASALEGMGDPAIPHLKKVLEEGDRAVRRIVERILKAIENR